MHRKKLRPALTQKRKAFRMQRGLLSLLITAPDRPCGKSPIFFYVSRRRQGAAWREVLEFFNASKSEPTLGASIERSAKTAELLNTHTRAHTYQHLCFCSGVTRKLCIQETL